MNFYLSLLVTFLCGAGYEFSCVFWVYYSEKYQAIKAVIWSMTVALITVIGVEQFLKGFPFVIAYVLGYGAGTYFAIKIKQKYFTYNEGFDGRQNK